MFYKNLKHIPLHMADILSFGMVEYKAEGGKYDKICCIGKKTIKELDSMFFSFFLYVSFHSFSYSSFLI